MNDVLLIIILALAGGVLFLDSMFKINKPHKTIIKILILIEFIISLACFSYIDYTLYNSGYKAGIESAK